MALPTSGALSMSAIHVEAEGSPYAHSGIVSLNDTNVRGLTPASGYTINSTAGTTISIGDFYGASALSTMTTTNYMRQASSGTSNFAGYSTQSQTSGIVIGAGGGFFVRLRRSDPYVYLEIREQSSSYSSNWYNTSGTASGLSTSYVNMGRFDLTGVTSIALDWTTPTNTGTMGGGVASGTSTPTSSTYAASDNSFQNVSNGQSIGLQFKINVNAECYANNVANSYIFVTARARSLDMLMVF